MPELPDVEGFRRVLDRHAKGRLIERVDVLDRSMLRGVSPGRLGRALARRRFREPERHGKWVIAPVGEDAELLLHFGMTGSLEWTGRRDERHPHDRIVFVCSGGELRYRNMRKFGGVWLGGRERLLRELGPDAREVGRDEFHDLLSTRRAAIKAALMDQKLLAGLGNLLADEILWRARVAPRTPVSRLGRRRRDALYDAMSATLRESIPAGRVPHGERWLTHVRDERNPACPRCGARMRKATVAGRTACWCPRCQRR